jgi:hypothetical protein
MKRLKEYIKEQETKGSLTVFDIDDTLFHTTAQIAVIKDGVVLKRLTNQEYNTYTLKVGEKFDYSEFHDANKFYKESKPIGRMLAKAKAILANSLRNPLSKVIIVTARSDFKDKEPFLQKFREHGFPIDQVYIERSGNLQKYMKSAKTPVTKAVVIRKYINSGKYNKIRMWDDHEGNLDILVKLSKLHPEIKIEAYLVDPETGNTTRYDR